MKKALASLIIGLLLIPSSTFAMSTAELEIQRNQLMQQLIVLLTAHLQQLLASQGQVLGVSTENLTATPKRSGGGGGGSRRSGGGGSSTPAPEPLVLTMQADSETTFTVNSNKTLEADSLVIDILEYVDSVPQGLPVSLGLIAQTSNGPLVLELTKDPLLNKYAIDLRGRLAAGVTYTGGFEVVIPSTLEDAQLLYQATYLGNGVTRTVNLTKYSDRVSNLSVAVSNDNPDSFYLVSDPDSESDLYTVLMFDIENDDGATARITDVIVNVSGVDDATNYLRRAKLIVDGGEWVGEVGTSTLAFNNMDIEIGSDDEFEFEIQTTLVRAAPDAFISFGVAGSGISAIDLNTGTTTSVSGSVTGETHSVVGGGIIIEAVSTSQSVTMSDSNAADTFGTFTIEFDVSALREDVYVYRGATSTIDSNGASFGIFGQPFEGQVTSVLTSTADLQGDYFRVDEGDTETITLTVALQPEIAGTYGIELFGLGYNSIAGVANMWSHLDPDDNDYQTDSVYIAN